MKKKSNSPGKKIKPEKEMFYNIKAAVIIIQCLLLLIILYLNISSSLSISPLYFSFIKEDENAAVAMLKDMRFTPEFLPLFAMAKNIYGNNLENDVNKDVVDRKQTIVDLENILQKM